MSSSIEQQQQQLRHPYNNIFSHIFGEDDDDRATDLDDPDDSATTPLSTSMVSSVTSTFPGSRALRPGVPFSAPPDHFLLSILVLFLCCPFGAVAVIKSLEAQAARERGQVQTAILNATLAKRWALLGLAVGLAFNFFGLMMILIYLCQSDSEDDVPVYQ